MGSSSIVISRCDRLGDLILSLPAVAHLKKHSKAPVILHVSEYASAIGEWAVFNGICDAYFVDAAQFPKSYPKPQWALSLFHCNKAVETFKALGITNTMGPRSKLSAMWNYKKSISQKRSQVKKSEMQYNVDLVDELLNVMRIAPSNRKNKFVGLETLLLPKRWKPEYTTGADYLVVISNGNSASNWPMSRYIEEIESLLVKDQCVDVLANGHDASERLLELRNSKHVDNTKLRIIEKFATLESLIVHISMCRRMISSSTGPLHIAHALGKPVKAVYPRIPKVQSFERWRPHGYWHDAPIEWTNI